VEVVVDARLRAVLTHEVDHDVNVVVAVLAHAVTDRRPTGRGLRPLGVVEVHQRHEVARDRVPLIVRQHALFGAQRQRAVPDVAARDLRTKSLLGAVQVARDRQSGIASKLGVCVPCHDRVIARDDVRLRVLVVASCASKVRQQSRHAIAAHDVRHHARTPS